MKIGSLIWIRRGEQFHQLAVVTAWGREYFEARVFNRLRSKWGLPGLIPTSMIRNAADPEDYNVRHALQFADRDLRTLWLGE